MTALVAHQTVGIEAFDAAMSERLKRVDLILNREPPKPGRDHDDWAATVYEAWAWCGFLFAWAVGAGKTLASLTIMYHWQGYVRSLKLSKALETELLRPFLIVGPAANRHVWEAQAHEHGVPLALFTAETDEDFRRAAGLLTHGIVEGLVVSYTGLARNAEKLARFGFSLGVFDEAQKITNSTIKQCQSIYRLSQMQAAASGTYLPGVPVRLALSGTPFLNHVEQLWPLLSYLQGYPVPHKRRKTGEIYHTLYSSPNLWSTREKFFEAYCEPITDSWGHVIKYAGRNLFHDPKANAGCKHHDVSRCGCLYNRMSLMVMHRVTVEEANANLPDSPPPEWVPVPLSAGQARLYQHVVDRAELPLVDEAGHNRSQDIARMALMTYAFEIAASTEQLRESLRARNGNGPEAAQHGLDLSFGLLPVEAESTKLDQIVDMVEEFDAPCLIGTGYARFARQIASDPRLQEYKPLLFSGDSGLKAADFESQMWSGNHRIGVMTTRGATGLNLQCAPYVIVAGFYDWSPLLVSQFIGRALRQGQKRRVLTYMLYAPGTIEEWLRRKLKVKMDSFAAAIDGRADGADDLGLGKLSDIQFRDIFYGK